MNSGVATAVNAKMNEHTNVKWKLQIKKFSKTHETNQKRMLNKWIKN